MPEKRRRYPTQSFNSVTFVQRPQQPWMTAQALLGHTTEAMTAKYIRHKVGKKVKPAG
jgi:integrase